MAFTSERSHLGGTDKGVSTPEKRRDSEKTGLLPWRRERSEWGRGSCANSRNPFLFLFCSQRSGLLPWQSDRNDKRRGSEYDQQKAGRTELHKECRSGGSDGAEDAPTGAPFLCLKCWLNSAGWLIIFLYQNQAAYLSSSCNPAKDEHIFGSLSLSYVQAFSLRYISGTPCITNQLAKVWRSV